jgi:hypothetical protein
MKKFCQRKTIPQERHQAILCAGSNLSVVCHEVFAACVTRSILDVFHYISMIRREFQPSSEIQPALRAEQQVDSEQQSSLAILISVNNCCMLIPETGWSERVFALTTPQLLFAPSAGSKFFNSAKHFALSEYDPSFQPPLPGDIC